MKRIAAQTGTAEKPLTDLAFALVYAAAADAGVELGPSLMAPPYSWALVFDELGRFLVRELGLADDAALASVLRAQRACLPGLGRSLPEVVVLPHDVVAWQEALMLAKGDGRRGDWTDVVPRLATFGPGTLTVDDSDRVAETWLGLNRELSGFGVSWDLESPLSRARMGMIQATELLSDMVARDGRVEQHPAAG